MILAEELRQLKLLEESLEISERNKDASYDTLESLNAEAFKVADQFRKEHDYSALEAKYYSDVEQYYKIEKELQEQTTKVLELAKQLFLK